RAIRARDEVLGVVAHDLRNPLHTIVMQASLLRRRGPEPERRSRRPSDTIERAAARMRRIIEDLLDVTRLESGILEVRCAAVPPGNLLAELALNQQDSVASRGLELRLEVTDTLPMVWADKDRLLQVFDNLIGNAMKFTKVGNITVGAEAKARE